MKTLNVIYNTVIYLIVSLFRYLQNGLCPPFVYKSNNADHIAHMFPFGTNINKNNNLWKRNSFSFEET